MLKFKYNLQNNINLKLFIYISTIFNYKNQIYDLFMQVQFSSFKIIFIYANTIFKFYSSTKKNFKNEH